MKYCWFFCCLLASFRVGNAAEPLKLEPNQRGEVQIRLSGGMTSALELQTPVPPIVSLRFANHQESVPYLVFNREATEARLEFSTPIAATMDTILLIESVEKSGQQQDGRFLFPADDAIVKGTVARLESHPGNHRIGFWSNLDDLVVWEFDATRPGTYSAEITYSLDGNSESDVSLQLGDAKHSQTLSGTGSWYRYRTVELGTIKVPSANKYTLVVMGRRKTGAALMNLKSIVLRPAPEGEPIVQTESGEILCHARDVTIHGVKVQYEPRPEKNTVGFWTNPKDTVSWDFRVNRPGEFDVEILQGCGTGHGGSDVSVLVNDQKLTFVVEDTGHFQNFKPRIIGRVKIGESGVSTLKIVPLNKASVAVMDVRQVRLIPVK